ncbi:methylmalonyl-CoA mutase family protein [Hymenobacter sp. GOD-10R]|uniref:methylmalonyl-CoA mutase family protein n=1 Tax=Hymenobacter sp. GOD-10R TaxID=3093922 RepID=UPI002D774B4B|nr:methylmalonyl-CoA mutase family protein [Hymenobacter sp. GOD-10R]WRQ29758.1 methylmalonyl-CoA mutase family protein [Hymenobacter sp. GOD-10R]
MSDTPQPTPVSFSEFEPLSTAAWQERIRRDLKGADLASLEWHTPEGFTVQPFYHREALAPLGQPTPQLPTSADQPWLNVPSYRVPAADSGHDAIDRATQALTAGADGAHFMLADARLFDVEYLHQKLPLPTTYISYSVQTAGLGLVQRLLATGADTLRGFLQQDPLTSRTPNLASQLGELRHVLRLTRAMPNFRGLSLNIDCFGNSGATATQQLGFALSTAATYLSELPNTELTTADVAAAMQVHVAINPNFFVELTKLRALRRVWATLLHAYQLPVATAVPVFASTATWSQTTLDPHTNLLRATTETMAAVLGGADAVSIRPFDSIYEAPNDFSARIARNISIILREETGLGRVADPAAGSYYLETLTDELARGAWALFQRLEAAGGLPAATSVVVQELHEAAQTQFRRIATGEQMVVGTNRFQNAHEQFSFNPKRLLRSRDFDTTRATYPSEVLRLATAMHFQRREKKIKRAAVVLLGPHTNQHILESFVQTLPLEERPELAAAHPVGTLSVLFSSPEQAILMYATPEQYNAFARAINRADPEDPSFAAPTLVSADLATLQEAVQFFGFQEFTVNGYTTEEVLARLQGK